MKNLFQIGEFKLNSGAESSFKIECDALTKQDWDTLAQLVAKKYTFSHVYGVPRGGQPLAISLHQFCTPGANLMLIVDDVLTTGGSMERARVELDTQLPIQGVVAFARNKPPGWIDAVFTMTW